MGRNGYLMINVNDIKKIGIRQLHLEEYVV